MGSAEDKGADQLKDIQTNAHTDNHARNLLRASALMLMAMNTVYWHVKD
jgi:hypothetical protein